MGDVAIQVELVKRDSPDAAPTAPIASAKTLAAAGLNDQTALELAAQCPWLDQKHFGPSDFKYPLGRDNAPPNPPPAVSQVGTVLNYDGTIDTQFVDILKSHTFDSLVINSPGGLLSKGLSGGTWLRDNKKIVRVEKECSSACIYVLAGGTWRIASEQAKVGVHRFYSDSSLDGKTALQEAQISDAEIVKFLETMGISNELFVAMQQVPSEEMRYVDHDKLLEWKLLTPDPTQPDSNGFITASGQDAAGNDLTKSGAKVKDLEGCEQSCRENSACRAFTFDTLNSFCFLKDGVDVVVFDSRAVIGYKTGEGLAPRAPVSLLRRDRAKLLGPPYKTEENLGPGECMALCLKDEKCKGYNFESTKNLFSTQKTCSLLSRIEGTSADDTVTSGQRNSGVDIVSAFYAALTQGDGQAAQGFLVPEKRGRGNFDPGAMTKFYGSLVEHLSLRDASQISADEVHVQYHYIAGAGACDGSASVTLRQVASDLLIDTIQPAGC